jgi:hypothetical protein
MDASHLDDPFVHPSTAAGDPIPYRLRAMLIGCAIASLLIALFFAAAQILAAIDGYVQTVTGIA